MIKTLKSELKLRPTYDEMIGMINEQGNENRPSIENVIDRRASLFRNNQFGSQFDKVDFLGLKKQEEDKVKNELRQTQLRQNSIRTGSRSLRASGEASSMGVLSYNGRTPRGAYGADNFATPDSEDYQTINRARAELEMYQQQIDRASQSASSALNQDLDDVHRQQLPEGIPIHSIATDDDDDNMPPLETPTEVAEEEEEEQSMSSLQKSVAFINNFDPDKIMENDNITYEDLLFQLYVRDKLNDTMIDTIKTRADDEAKKRHAVSLMEGLKQNDEWNVFFTKEELRRKANEFKEIKKRLKQPFQPSSSSSGIVDTVVSGAKSLGGSVLEAGKEAVIEGAKNVAVEVAKGALMSVL